jgi:HSP20 family protein
MAEMKKQNDQNEPNQNLPVQRGQQTQQPARQSSRGDVYRNPWQLMRDFMRDPFGAMVPYGSEFAPQMEVRETDDAFLFKADLPGIRKEDIEISVHGNRLQLSGRRDDEHEQRDGDKIYAYERSYGSFTRVFTLPETANVDQISTELKDGVLAIVVPKKPTAQPRKIQIGAGGKA